jgi:hypothetical protein
LGAPPSWSRAAQCPSSSSLFLTFQPALLRDFNLVPDIDGELSYLNLKIVHKPNKTGFEETREFPIKMHDIIAGRYEVTGFLGSAAFSRAIQCLDRRSGQMVAMKIIKNNKDFFDQCLDEVKLLRYIQLNGDPDKYNVIRMFGTFSPLPLLLLTPPDFFYYKEHLFICTELLGENLYEFYKARRDAGALSSLLSPSPL